MAQSLQRDLQQFTVSLLERSGALADWPEPEAPGFVAAPAELAAAAHLPGEEFAVGFQPAPRQLHVALGGDFLDTAARLLNARVPREASFHIPLRTSGSRDLAEKIGQTFVWQNARGKYGAAEPRPVEYHVWTLQLALKSEDAWETIVRFAVNAESQAILDLPDIHQEFELAAAPLPAEARTPHTYEAAVREGKRRLLSLSAAFVSRIEQRLERDRKRLAEYYRALLREAGGSSRRAVEPAAPEELAAKQRAVELELRRKQTELLERYAMQAALFPVTVARVRLPALVTPIIIQRKQATREFRIYWNSLTRKLEPLACGRCGRPTFSPTFTNDTVEAQCTSCAEG